MGVEIERRFLVSGDGWKKGASRGVVVQGYLSTEPGRVVRVRLTENNGYLTVKGPATGPSRPEFEYPIPVKDAQEMLALCGDALVKKIRWQLRYAGRDWVVDEFAGANAGLILAEIELPTPDQPFALPPWVGQEVTGDHRYSNASLALRPYGPDGTFGDRPPGAPVNGD